MALDIWQTFATGASLSVSIRRASDGFYYDFAATGPTPGAFAAVPTTQFGAMTTETGNFSGRYHLVLTNAQTGLGTQSIFPDGDYLATVHNAGSSNQVIGTGFATMWNGDQASTGQLTAAANALFDLADAIETGQTYRKHLRQMAAVEYGNCTVTATADPNVFIVAYMRADGVTISRSATFNKQTGARTATAAGTN